ncbi:MULTISPECIES: N-acetylmuramoyl-L-alanine amidase [unclassified Clostridioides]|uniref:N-acetylmuramoyl-L-alanine amidase n=1 Tax=unclassified Clostridioides TaxID=2635829 RepID=UPI001D10CD7E
MYNLKVVVIPGHTLTGKGTGAVGYINEGKETRIISDLVVKWLKLGGATVYTGRVDKSDNHLADQCAIANKQETDLAVQIHFNANVITSVPEGTETIYKSNNGKTYAEKVNSKLATVFKNRGAKADVRGLYWLNHTNSTAILIEVCFVDSKVDTDYYVNNKDKVAKLIAEGILNKSISNSQGGDKVYENVIVYKGDADKVAAQILYWQLKDALVVEASSYKQGLGKKVYVVGGEANNLVKGDVIINGADRYETVKLALRQIGKL